MILLGENMERIVSHRVTDLEVEGTAGEARFIITAFLKVRCLYPRMWNNSGWTVCNRREAEEGKMFVLFFVPVGGRITASSKCLHPNPRDARKSHVTWHTCRWN